MPEAARTEFWRDLKPIDKVFRKHSLPEMFTPGIATDDERFYMPLSETVGTRPVWISVSQNSWCDVLMAKGRRPRQPPLREGRPRGRCDRRAAAVTDHDRRRSR